MESAAANNNPANSSDGFDFKNYSKNAIEKFKNSLAIFELSDNQNSQFSPIPLKGF